MKPITPQAFAVTIAGMGFLLGIVGYLFPGTDAARHDVYALAGSLVSGALGAFTSQALHSAQSGNDQP